MDCGDLRTKHAVAAILVEGAIGDLRQQRITYTIYVNTFMEREWGVPLVDFSTGRFKCG
jgi:hypothetical protein